MNILFLTNKPPFPSTDGSSLATLNMIIGLAEAGIKVNVLAFATQKHPCRLDQIPAELKSKISFEIVEIDTSINPFKAILNLFFSRTPFNIERFISKTYRKRLSSILNDEKFDIVQLEGLYLAPYINDIRKECDSTIIYRSHNVENEIWSRIAGNEKNWIKALYFRTLSRRIEKSERNLTNQVDALVAISKRDASWFLSNGFSKPTVTIPSGYRSLGVNEIHGLANNDICFLGSLDWIPNQEGLTWFLDNVWPIIFHSNSSVTMHIAGRNAPPTLIKRLTVEPRIRYHGEVESAYEYLSNYSILVVPLLSGSGMRVRIVEGMMLGKAIVTTSVGIEGIDANNREEVIINDDPADFAASVIDLINNPPLRASIAEKARTFAMGQFDNSVLTQRLIEFYKKID